MREWTVIIQQHNSLYSELYELRSANITYCGVLVCTKEHMHMQDIVGIDQTVQWSTVPFCFVPILPTVKSIVKAFPIKISQLSHCMI